MFLAINFFIRFPQINLKINLLSESVEYTDAVFRVYCAFKQSKLWFYCRLLITKIFEYHCA